MSRVAPATFWQEVNVKRAAASAILAYPTFSASTGWTWSTASADQDGTFTLSGSTLTLDPGTVSGGKAALLGSTATASPIVTPTSILLASYVAGDVGSLTITRADTATYVAKTGD